ncbi:MAG: ankyrin repeat domain-containing protein [Acidobacteriota bacterium]
MLERGASPNVADEQGWTAVHQAVSRGNEKILKAVLDAGGDSSRKDNEGNTPLELAQAKRRPKIVALLGG